jgi:hypothetical protein
MDEESNGFEVEEGVLPVPPVRVGDDVRARMTSVIAAIVCGSTPEQITGYLQDGFPSLVIEMLERPGEVEEMHGHIDVLLFVQQSPALATSG